jgi:hypothetical protein
VTTACERRQKSFTAFWQTALAGVLVVGAPGYARAQGSDAEKPLSVTLEYDVPDTCPDEQEFRTIVTKRLGRDPFVEGASNRVLVLVSPADNTISGELVWRDNAGSSTGKQNFPSRTNHCAQVIAAMGFALAVQIQLLEIEDDGRPRPISQGALAAEPPPPPKAIVAPTRPSVEPEAPAVTVRASKPHGAAPIFSVGGGGAGDLGMSPHLVAAGRVFAGVRWALAAVELALAASAPVTTRRADGAGFSQWYLLASAAGCGVIEPWSACAVFKAGSVRVAGRDIDAPSGASAAIIQSGLRLALSQRLNASTALSFRGEGLVNLTRWSVTLDHLPVWSAPRLALESGLDFVVFFR